jgi:TPR repeat protein
MKSGKPLANYHVARLIASQAAIFLLFTVSPAPTFAAQETATETWRALREEALAFEHGEGVPKDLKKAAALYCRGAKAG